MKIDISKSFFSVSARLLNKDFDKQINEHILSKSIYEILIKDEIINEKYQNIEWKIIENKFQGIYIRETNIIVYFSQLLDSQGKIRSRNTFLTQNFLQIVKFSQLKKSKIQISINPFDINKKPNLTPSIKLFLDMFSSMEVIINNSINHTPIQITLDEFLEKKQELKKINKFSTFITKSKDKKEIWVYGRLEGASGVETFLTCKFLKYSSEKYILFYFLDISHNKINKDLLPLIKDLGFIIENTNEKGKIISELKKKNDFFDDENEELLKRNQRIFLRNILLKYTKINNFNINKCFACDYLITKNLIAAHIHRYTDIKDDYKNNKISMNEAFHLVTSGDNGFLLCPNQDAEFEKGHIIFDLEKGKFIANKQKLNDYEYAKIIEEIKMDKFDKNFITEEFKNNVLKHLKRIK